MNNKITQPKKQNRIVEQHAAVYSGPLPPSQELMNYNNIIPGAAERIITMAEKEAEHRRSAENLLVAEEVRSSKTGQRFAFVLGFGSLIVVTVSILMNQPMGTIAPAINSNNKFSGVFIKKRKIA